jgi:hypothetical protein
MGRDYRPPGRLTPRRHVSPTTQLALTDSTQQTPEDETFVIKYLDRFRALVLARLVDVDLSSSLMERYADILRQASVVYRYDTSAIGGTTGGVVPIASEAQAYWALDILVHDVNNTRPSENVDARSSEAPNSLATIALPTLMQRFEEALRRHVDDTKIRGRVPLAR